MPEATRSSRAYAGLTAARKALQTTKADTAAIKMQAAFDVKKLGQKQDYQQAWFQVGQDTLSMAQSGAALYEDYDTLLKGKDELGRKAYEKALETGDELVDESGRSYSEHFYDVAHGEKTMKDISWDELTPELKEQFLPQRDYDFDTSSMWGQIRKPLEDLSEFTGDIDPEYRTHPTLGGKPFKASSIKAVSDVKASEELRELLGIPSQFQSNRPNIPDPLAGQQAKTAAAASSYTGTADQNTALLKKLRNILGPTSYTGVSIDDYLISKGMGANQTSKEELWKKHM